MDEPSVSLRFALLLEAYLRACGGFMKDLINQSEVMIKLTDTATAIKRCRFTAERKEILAEETSRMQLPASFQLPLDSKFECKGLVRSKVKYMDSKKVSSLSN